VLVKNTNYYVLDSGPLALEFCFSLFVLGNVLSLYIKQRNKNNSVASDDVFVPPPVAELTMLASLNDDENEDSRKEIKWNFVVRTSQLVLVFVLSLGVAVGVRLYQLFSQKHVPLWVMIVHHCSVAITPIGNFFCLV